MIEFTSPCFWGIKRQDEFLQKIRDLSEEYGFSSLFAGDNLIALDRNLSFISDLKFMSAISAVAPNNFIASAIIWRMHVFCWAAQNGLSREGDLAECGVGSGACSAVMTRYLNFENVPKKLFLYDVWDTDARISQRAYVGSTLAHVTALFAPYSNVQLVPGYIPDSLRTTAPDKISFLHIDLNDAKSEVSVLDEFFDLVTPGSVLLFDDYGHSGFRESRNQEDAWMQRRGYRIVELPTGQGLVIK